MTLEAHREQGPAEASGRDASAAGVEAGKATTRWADMIDLDLEPEADCAEEAASAAFTFNAAAAEYVPSFSLACPAVTYCVVMLVPADGCPPAGDAAASPSGSQAAVARRWRRRKTPAAPTVRTALAPAPVVQAPSEGGAMPEVSEEAWQHRIQMRRRELEGLEARILAAARREVGHEADGLLLKAMAVTAPDATDRSMSRRAWKQALAVWFKGLMDEAIPEEGRSSVASTEEWPSPAPHSPSCDGASECSE